MGISSCSRKTLIELIIDILDKKIITNPDISENLGTLLLKEFFPLKESVYWSQCSQNWTTGPTVFPLELNFVCRTYLSYLCNAILGMCV
jgi:hypothetical protein